MFTYVAIPFQIKEMTNSYLAVGISGAVELIPLVWCRWEFVASLE